MRTWLLLLAVVTTSSAYATKARLSALNQDVDGSYYLMDTRNIFLNPAQIADQKDSLNFELGKRVRDGSPSTIPDNEGGFVMSLGAGKLGAQVGRVTDFNRLIREVNFRLPDLGAYTTGDTFGEGQNNVDILYGGGAGDLKWGGGLGVTRSKAATATAAKETYVQALDLRGGVHTEKFEAFGSLLLGAESKTDLATTSATFNEKYGLRAGGGFQLSPLLRLYGKLSYDNYEASIGDGTHDFAGTRFDVLGGLAYVHDLASRNGRWFASADLRWLDSKATDNAGSLPEEQFSFLSVPLTLGVEADANSWLRARASVKQNVLLGYTKDTRGNTPTASSQFYAENAPNMTAVSVGVGATMNNFNVDVAMIQVNDSDSGHFETSVTYLF